MSIWIIIFGMATVTYLPRLIPLTTVNEALLSSWMKRSLNYVPIVVLSAIVGMEIVPSEAWFHYRVDAHLVAGIVAIGIAWVTRNTVLTVIGGIGILLFLN